jgi:hypothetical protein
MINFVNKITIILKEYKWLLIPGFPLIIIILMLLMITSSSKPPENSFPDVYSEPTGIPTRIIPTASITIIPTPKNYDALHPVDPEMLNGLQKTETLPDGAIKYTLASPKSSRSNTLIAKDNLVIFQRSVRPDNFGERISDYTNQLGTPERIITGSRFYGENTQTYIYAKYGVAFTANPQTEEVYEQFAFVDMSVDDFFKSFGQEL